MYYRDAVSRIFCFPIFCFSQTVKGKVIRVADDDTISILDSANTQACVRLYGIDCPENVQDFADIAKKLTSDLCFSKIVTVDIKDIDRYKRTVGIGGDLQLYGPCE